VRGGKLGLLVVVVGLLGVSGAGAAGLERAPWCFEADSSGSCTAESADTFSLPDGVAVSRDGSRVYLVSASYYYTGAQNAVVVFV
jgi:hypothetical protein